MKRIISLFLFFCIIGIHSAEALTLSDIRTSIRREVHDNPADTARRRYSDTVLNDLINEGQREITIAGDLADKTTVYTLSPRTTYYILPTDVIGVKQIYFTDKFFQLLELEEKPQKSLYDKNPQWERNSGSPNSYWISQATHPRNQQSAPLRISYIPIPTNLSTGTVTIWYSYIMSDLSADTDVPFENRRNLYPYHAALIYYTVVRLKVTEGKISEASTYQQLYTSTLNSMKGKLGEMPNYTPGIAIPGVNR